MELDKNNEQLQKDFSAGQPFFNVSWQPQHLVGNLKLSQLDLNEINENLNKVFKELNCAGKLNLALEFSEMWTKINIDSFTLMTTRSLKSLKVTLIEWALGHNSKQSWKDGSDSDAWTGDGKHKMALHLNSKRNLCPLPENYNGMHW